MKIPGYRNEKESTANTGPLFSPKYWAMPRSKSYLVNCRTVLNNLAGQSECIS